MCEAPSAFAASTRVAVPFSIDFDEYTSLFQKNSVQLTIKMYGSKTIAHQSERKKYFQNEDLGTDEEQRFCNIAGRKENVDKLQVTQKSLLLSASDKNEAKNISLLYNLPKLQLINWAE